MVVEVAIFDAVAGKADALAQGICRGIDVIRQSPGCLAIRVHRGIESPGRCILYIEWESLAAHTETFRGGPLFPKWREHINGLFDGTPRVEHFEVIAR